MKKVKFLEITEDMVEGKDYINISVDSSTSLGKLLSPYHKYKFKTVAGDVRSISKFMQYISTEGFPQNLAMKPRLNKSDVADITKLKTLNIPNYWAILCYCACERIKQDPTLQDLLKSNNLPLTMVVKEKIPSEVTDLTKASVCIRNVTKYGYYLEIVRDIEKLLKDDNFNKDNITSLIESYKKVDVDLFEGTSLILK